MDTRQREQERRIRMSHFAFERAGTPIFWIDASARIIRVNQAGCQSLGYTMDELVGMTLLDVDPDYPMQEWPAAWARLKREKVVALQTHHRTKGGRVFPVEVSANYIEFEGNEYSCTFVTDISERRRAEAARIRLATAVEQAAEAIIITDQSQRIRYVNPAHEKLWGYSREETLGQGFEFFQRLMGTEVAESIRQALDRGQVWRGRVAVRRKDGSQSETEATVSPVRDETGGIINYVGVHRDVTEQVQLEARLAQSQKMEALGTLAGGIAHDFNNILTPVIGYAQLMLDEVDGPLTDEQRKDLDRIVTAGTRAQDLVGQILAFAKKGAHVPERQPIHLREIVEETLALLRASLPATIEIQSKIEAADDTALANPTQVQQILLNLCTNASHAIADAAGKITVSLAEVEVDAVFIARHPGLSEGPYLRLTVADTGCGMSNEVSARIFEPFFTTKSPQRGTGMGLAVVHGIVKSHGGAIFVYSEPGRGSSFQVFLPRAPAADSAKPKQPDPVPRGKERVLVVDDEEIVADFVHKILEGLGYRVVTTTNGEKALEWIRADPQSFDLVICDQTMPGGSGLSLIREMSRIRPGIPAILCTGLNSGFPAEATKAAGVREVVLKPLTTRELGGAVRRVLDGETPSGGSVTRA